MPRICAICSTRLCGQAARRRGWWRCQIPEFRDWYISGAHVPCCQVAVLGEVRLGFQGLSVTDRLPADWVDIGTFTPQGSAVRGVGTTLFAATRARAARLGFTAINATIRADIVPGVGLLRQDGLSQRQGRPGRAADRRAVGRQGQQAV